MAFAGQKLRASDVSGTAAGERLLASDIDGIAGQPVRASQVDD